MGQERKLTSEDYSFEARWGVAALDEGVTPIPNVVLNHYAEVGLSSNQAMFVVHCFQYKWTAADPYPSFGTIAKKMGVSRRQVRSYAKELEGMKFNGKPYLRRIYRTKEDGSPDTSILNFEGLLEVCINATEARKPDPEPTSGGLGRILPKGVRKNSSDKEKAVEKEKTTDSAPGKPVGDHQEPKEQKDRLSANSDLIERANNLGYHNIACEISRFGREYVEEKISLTEKAVEDGKAKNPACFLNAALRNDFRTEKEATDKTPVPQTEEETESPVRKVLLSIPRREKEKILDEAEMSLSDRERDELYRGFVSKGGLSGAIKEVWNFAIMQVLMTRGYLGGATG